jgi:hypothetical protein
MKALIPLARLLTGMPAVRLTIDGVRRAVHGRDLGADDLAAARCTPEHSFVRLLDPAGALVGVAEPSPSPGLLHPAVILV